jgi:hypothetical protein
MEMHASLESMTPMKLAFPVSAKQVKLAILFCLLLAGINATGEEYSKVTDVNGTSKECIAVVVDTIGVQSNTGYFIPNLFCTSLNYTKLFYIY